jgi:hypothetical protein
MKELINKFRECETKALQFGGLFSASQIQAKL